MVTAQQLNRKPLDPLVPVLRCRALCHIPGILQVMLIIGRRYPGPLTALAVTVLNVSGSTPRSHAARAAPSVPSSSKRIGRLKS